MGLRREPRPSRARDVRAQSDPRGDGRLPGHQSGPRGADGHRRRRVPGHGQPVRWIGLHSCPAGHADGADQQSDSEDRELRGPERRVPPGLLHGAADRHRHRRGAGAVPPAGADGRPRPPARSRATRSRSATSSRRRPRPASSRPTSRLPANSRPPRRGPPSPSPRRSWSSSGRALESFDPVAGTATVSVTLNREWGISPVRPVRGPEREVLQRGDFLHGHVQPHDHPDDGQPLHALDRPRLPGRRLHT